MRKIRTPKAEKVKMIKALNATMNAPKPIAGVKFFVLFAALALVAACSPKKKEIVSKVDPNAYLSKADFKKGPYHFSRAIEEADSKNRVDAIPGFQMDFGIVNIEITESELRLVNAFDPTGREKTAQVLASFPIKQHFDIIREENDFKEKTNKIVEDMTKPWNQRQFMRVDWSKASNEMGSILTQLSGRRIEEENTVLKTDPTVEADGHISFLVETGINDHKTFSLLPPFGEELISAYRVTYRTHLMPVRKSDFKPVSYGLKDFGRFGYFVTQQNFENPEQGFLDKDLKIYANVFNVCEAGRSESCSTNQIKWVLTKNFPEAFLPEARQAIKVWNDTFKEQLNRSDDVVVLDEQNQVDLGDTRFNTIAYYEPKTNAGLLGVAQGVVDPRTGEKISVRATVYEDGIRHELGVVDNIIDIVSSSDPLADVIGTEAFGPMQSIDSPYASMNKMKMIAQNRALGLDKKAGASKTAQRPGMSDLINIVGLKNEHGVSSPGRNQRIPPYLKGNAISKGNLNVVSKARPDLLRIPELDLLANSAEASGEGDQTEVNVTERMLKIADRIRLEKKALLRQSALGVHGSDLVDEAVIRFLARQVKQSGNVKALASQKAEIKSKIAKLVFYTTLLHEMGHTFGLRHNFKASADRKHYYPEWQSVKNRIGKDKEASHDDLAPYAYSSIMDYGADFHSQAGGLGPYDKAAIKYAYNRSINRDGDKVTKDNYLFCTDHQVGEDLLCQRFDQGSTVTEVTEYAINTYNRNWALTHFRRGRAQFERLAGGLADRLISRTMIPVRKVMDEFIYSIITDKGPKSADSKCPFQILEASIQNKDMANICDPAVAASLGVNPSDLMTFGNALFDNTGKPLQASGDLKPYALADLLTANILAQNFFAEVIGSLEPGFYLAQEQKSNADEEKDPAQPAGVLPRRLIPLDKELSSQDLADLKAGKESPNRALIDLAEKNGADPTEFIKANAKNLVRIDLSRQGRPFGSTSKDEGTMRSLQSAGSLADKVAATIALALRDVGVNKYDEISMSGNAYTYPQSKVFASQLFTNILAGNFNIALVDVELPDGKKVPAIGPGTHDINIQRIGTILALTQFASDADPSAVQKLRVCIAGEPQCGNALSAQVAESWNSAGSHVYRATQTLEEDSISFELVSLMKKESDKRTEFIELLKNAEKIVTEDFTKLSGSGEIRARIATNLAKAPELAAKLNPLIEDPKEGVAPQGFGAVVVAIMGARESNVETYVGLAGPALDALKAGGMAIALELRKMGDEGKCESGDEAAKATCSQGEPALKRAALIQALADFKLIFEMTSKAAIDVLKIKQAPTLIKRGSAKIEKHEVIVEMLRSIMGMLGMK